MDIKSLLARGFLPKEYPPPFTSLAFAAFATEQGVKPQPRREQKRLQTVPAVHNLARPGGLRRRLHIPNPFSYTKIASLVTENWPTIAQRCIASPLSVSVPVDDETGLRALRTRSGGGELATHRARVRSSARVVLRTDIARFYPSIYTHSVPWALTGKAAAKSKRKGGFPNDLDEALRDAQDGQTLGIPVGPDTSLAISELLASAIDTDLAGAGFNGFRFMDDYEFGFGSRASAEAALAKIEEVVAQYELAINLRKTSIDQLPIELDRPWTSEIRTYPAIAFTAPNVLVRYFSRVFELKQQFPHEPVLAYAVARLRNVSLIGEWSLLRDLLCQCALAEPGTIEPVVTLLQQNTGREIAPAIDAVIQTVLEHHVDLAHGSELAWALWAAIWFKRKLPTILANRLDGNSDPAVALLALFARDKGLIRRSSRFKRWLGSLSADSLYGPMWLLAYEAAHRQWVSADYIRVVSEDPNFGPLLKAGISFFDEAVEAPTKTLMLGVPAATLSIYGRIQDATDEESDEEDP